MVCVRHGDAHNAAALLWTVRPCILMTSWGTYRRQGFWMTAMTTPYLHSPGAGRWLQLFLPMIKP